MSCPKFLNEICFKEKISIVIDTTRSGFDFKKNSIDPFSMIFKLFLGDINLKEGIKNEKLRQYEKRLQNKIGEFQQNIISCVDGFERISVVDLKNDNAKIICEVKNKYNTMNAGGRTEVYDKLDHLLQNKYKNYTGYLVEIISDKKKRYDIEFTPPDSKTKTNRQKNKNIRVIDGQTFYSLITDNENALKEIYDYIPHAISEIYNVDFKKLVSNNKNFEDMFFNVFS